VIGLEHGSLIYINYTAKIKDTGEVLETTWEEEAKKLGIYNPSSRYTPKLVVVNEGWVLKGLDEALTKAKVGEKLTVEVPPEKGFGHRDPSKIRLIPLRKFGDKAAQLKVGDEVEVDGKIGVVRLIGSGRVSVDFNHRLAGKTLIYEVEVVKELIEKEEKAKALIARRLGLEESKVNIAFEDEKAIIDLPEEVFFAEGLQYIKRAITFDLFKYLEDVKEVIFQERFKAPPAEEKKEEKEEEKEEEKGEVKEEKAEKPSEPEAQTTSAEEASS
jgi:FKBP-type peptidyl-prolyl cis-trans isomerase 2